MPETIDVAHPDYRGVENRYAVFYAFGDKFIRADVEDGSVRNKVGETVRLNVRSLHERCANCTQRCNRGWNCCTNEPNSSPCVSESQREYKIVGTKVFEGDRKFGGDDGIHGALADREWEDLRACNYDEDRFDAYYALNMLGVCLHPLEFFPLTGSIIVDLE